MAVRRGTVMLADGSTWRLRSCSRVERSNHESQESSQNGPLPVVQDPEDGVFPFDEVGQRRVHPLSPRRRELDAYGAGIGWVGTSSHKAAHLEMIEPIRHRP
jgi:hypothetical protein